MPSKFEAWYTRAAFERPARVPALLRAYFALLGEDRLWWQRCAEAEDPRWKVLIRAEVARLAKWLRTSPSSAADYLDRCDELGCHTLLTRILTRARAAFYGK